MIVTEWRKLDPNLTENLYLKQDPRRPKRIRVEYGLEAGEFMIRGDVQEKTHGRWRAILGGSISEPIATHFPELAPYLKWEGFDPGDPVYEYLDGDWRAVGEGNKSVDNFGYLVQFGTLPDDVMPPIDTPWPEVLAWLRARHPYLAEVFRADMRELGRVSGPGFRGGPGFEGPKAWYPGMGDGKDWSPRWGKRTPEDLKKQIEEYLRGRELMYDTHVYTHDEWLERGEKYGRTALVTITTEGAFYSVLNDPVGPNARELEKFIGFLDRLGLWYEQGYAWTVHVYPKEV